MEWPLYQDGTPLMETEKMDQFPIHIRDELLREFREELECEEAASHDAIGYMSDRLSDTYALTNNEDIRAIVPLAICQNYERGGKPEFFFIIFSNHNTDYYAATPRNGLEHQHKLGNVLLSPVSIHGVLRHASIVALAMQQIDELINQPDLNSVLRASLILFNQYVQRLIAKKAGIQRNQEVQQQPNYRVSARSTPS